MKKLGNGIFEKLTGISTNKPFRNNNPSGQNVLLTIELNNLAGVTILKDGISRGWDVLNLKKCDYHVYSATLF